MAAQVHVAESRDVFRTEAADHLSGVRVEEFVVVPGEAVGVHEDAHVWQLVVEVDDVAQIDHDFVAFILWRVERGCWVVGDVDGGAQLPVWCQQVCQLGLHPCCVLLFGAG